MRHIPHSRTAIRTKTVQDDRARRIRQTIVALAAASALALSSLALARADETWVTINPDGSVTRSTTATVQPSPSPALPNITVQVPSAQVPNTTFFSGTYYPVPQYYGPRYPTPYYPVPNIYTYQNPGGVTYPIGPAIPGFQSPTITTLPSTGAIYGYPGFPAYTPYPTYSYPQPYPLYGTTGTFYSGPAGGGGTITSSSTTSNNGISIGYGKRGWKFNVGNGTRSSHSSTTVTTSR